MEPNVEAIAASASRVVALAHAELSGAKRQPEGDGPDDQIGSHQFQEVVGDLEASLERLLANPDLTVHLYAPSQTGKSTLVSFLTGGEQYVPIGQGTATTAIEIELRRVEPGEAPRALGEWLAPSEVGALIAERLEAYGFEPPGRQPASGSESSPAAIDLADRQTRKRARDALRQAVKARVAERGSQRSLTKRSIEGDEPEKDWDDEELRRSGESIVVAQLLISFFDRYRAEYTPEQFGIPLDEVDRWTRNPERWNTAPVDDLTYEEVRSLFMKRVQLALPADPALQGLRIVDAPGFGVSSLHNEIGRRTQEAADATLVVLGSNKSEITHPQLEQLGRLATGLRTTTCAIWNANGADGIRAQELLAGDLGRLRNEVGISIPSDRAVVVNVLHLLRAKQRECLDSGKLSDMTIAALAKRRPNRTGKSDRELATELIDYELRKCAEDYCGLDGDPQELAEFPERVRAMLQQLPSAVPNRRLHECAEHTLRVLSALLERYPTPAELQDYHADAKALRELLPSFNDIKATHRASLKVGDEDRRDACREAAETLSDRTAVHNLQNSLTQAVMNELYWGDAATRLRATVADFVKTRLRVWLADVNDRKTRVGTAWAGRLTLACDNFADEFRLRQANERTASERSRPIAPELGILGNASIDQLLDEVATAVAELVVASSLVDRFTTFTKDLSRKVGNKLGRWFSNLSGSDYDERPAFDRRAALDEVLGHLQKVLGGAVPQALLAQHPATYRPASAKEQAFSLAMTFLSGSSATDPVDSRRSAAVSVPGWIDEICTDLQDGFDTGYAKATSALNEQLRARLARLDQMAAATTIGVSTLKEISELVDAIEANGHPSLPINGSRTVRSLVVAHSGMRTGNVT